MSPSPEPRAPLTASVEVALVMVAVLLLGLVGVPRVRDALERDRAAEAFLYLTRVESAQARHLARHGTFATHLGALDAPPTPPGHFRVGPLTAPDDERGFASGWHLTLTRDGDAGYTVVWSDAGWDAEASTIEEGVCPLQRDP